MAQESSSSDKAILTATGVHKSYDGTRVLQGVDLALAAGERVALMGPSGSGKSTLLNCLAGIDAPDAGEITIDGESLASLSGDALARVRRTKVSTVFQFFHLLPTLSVAENIGFPLQLIDCPPAEREDRVAALITEVKLDSRRDGYPDELSGGEMQRVAIARALVTRPRVILADEPTGSLDSANGEAVLELLENLTSSYGAALLLVTHNEDTTRICSRTVHMKDGRIVNES